MARGALAALLLSVCAARADEKQPIVTTDLLRLRTVSSVDVADDGSRAVLAVRSIEREAAPKDGADADERPSYAYRTHLFVLDLFDRAATPRRLTFGDRNDGSPKLAPDGRRIAFLRTGADGERSQVWLLRTDGGEARPLAELEHGADSISWSPDGTQLIVDSALPFDALQGQPPYPQERPGRAWGDAGTDPGATPRPDGTRQEIRAWLAANAEVEDPVVITRIDFQDELSLREPPTVRHLFLLDAENAEAEPRRITDGFFDHDDAAFMPDGRSLVYAAKKDVSRHPDRLRGTDLWQIAIDGTGDRKLLAREGWSFEYPAPSADGSVIAMMGRRLDEPAYRPWQLGLVSADPSAEAEPLWLTGPETYDADIYGFEWDRTRSSLLFVVPRNGAFPLMTISRGLLEPAALLERHGDQPAGVYAFDAGGGSVVSAVTTPATPCVLVVRDGHGERVAWDLNPWVRQRELSMPVEGWVSRPDGTGVQYWLMEPTRRENRKEYPLVLEIHGGPSAMWGPGELSMWHEFQLLCAWGYGVVYANPRGSGGYGYEFQRGNFQNWGEGPAGDVLAVVDHVAQAHDWIDPDRLVVTGGSYAGYLTAWIVAHDHRFKAAVAQRGVYELSVFFGEGNAWRLVEWAMGGWPFDSRYRQVIERNSPFTYVQRIKTPLLIMHASQDLRTGVSQSEMLYRALKALDRPVEYVRYPMAGHDLSRTGDPRQRMDRLDRIVEFFERHIDNPRTAPTQAP